ncbi:hypothetical protein ZHAS_00009407 [Anopheles sinensis]|uniref:Peptidase S1 domain-containing protein n=1 Tax=Anopheles sinensis TaxID=74873 RepID=A0A084VUX1_ANOSI|nr:hypothetical protein ZHAS_00009407 [Anopheles sinensis]
MEYPSIVRLGVYDILMDHGHEVPIEGFLRHPEHSYFRAYHDIALVKLEHRVYFTSNIRPACLWYTESRNTTKFIVTGFDNNNSYGVPSTQLTKVVLEEFPGQDCAQRYKFLPRFSRGITDGQLCVGSDLEGRHACIGDPGSSLLTLTHPKTCMFHIVGITPIGPYGCGVGKTRALYTKVAHYLDWIEENVWGSKANLADTYKFNKFF